MNEGCQEGLKILREQIEATVGRINGDFSHLGDIAVHYLHQTDQWVVFPHELEGLTPEEVRQKGPVVYDVLHGSGERSAIP